MPLQLLNLGIIIPSAVMRLFVTRTPRGAFILSLPLCGTNQSPDFAELNAPPMVNYGVVYPQAIIVFVMTLLYSVVQPLIVIFGAIYFGVAYVVYKYKLLFGWWSLSGLRRLLLKLFSSILQAVRITGSSMDHNLYTIDLGRHHVPGIHDWDICAEEGVHYLIVGVAPPHRDSLMVVVYHQDLRTAE